jgi:para-nitrobenzyl esterase
MAAQRGFGPVLDGTYISQHPFVPGPAPYVADVTLLIGNNRDEATFDARNTPEIFKMDDAALVERLRRQLGTERADAVLPVYRRERPNATPAELYIAIATSRMWGSTLAEAESKVNQHGAPVYMYRYDYQSNRPIPGTDWTMRAGHATEIQAKFENADLPGLMGNAPDRFQAAHNLGESWATFARTGHPKVTGAPKWPAYDLKTRATMLINVECTVVNDPNKAEREIWQATMPVR